MRELVERAAAAPPRTVIVPGVDRPADAELIAAARDLPFVRQCLAVGDPDAIRRAAAAVGTVIDDAEIVAAFGAEAIAEATALAVADGRGEIVLKGNISTPLLTRRLLRFRCRATMSLATVFTTEVFGTGRPTILTDAGVTTVCTADRLRDIIDNAVELARGVLGIPRPKVAILSANEKLIPSLASTLTAAELAARDWPDADVAGPLSFDLATDPEAVRLKGLKDPTGVAGYADILVCPNLESANILYKVVMALARKGLAELGGVTLGASVPYSILSRADLHDTKINSIAICCLAAASEGAATS